MIHAKKMAEIEESFIKCLKIIGNEQALTLLDSVNEACLKGVEPKDIILAINTLGLAKQL